MGLNINGLYIQVDHSHNRLLNTGKEGNPVIQKIPHGKSSLTVYSTFQRLKAPASTKKHKKIGDNCPLLYALKGKNELKTTLRDIRLLLLHFDSILNDMTNKTQKYDAIIVMPSSHAISKIYAARLARKYQCVLLDNIFQKITVTDAQNLLKQTGLSSSDKRSISSKLKKQAANGQSNFSLKDIPTKFRSHFPPLTMSTGQIISNYQKILLADDLLATGTTLLTGKNLILECIPDASIDASCLFSAI